MYSSRYESVRAAVMDILAGWQFFGHLENVLKMINLHLSERPSGNNEKHLTPCRLRVKVREVGESEAQALGIVSPAYQIESSVIYLIWQEGGIPRAKRRDKLEGERQSSQMTLL